MKATWPLIMALRRAADRIEACPSDYCWTDFVRCNCGILAQELLSTDAYGLRKIAWPSGQRDRWFDSYWAKEAGRVCPSTGRPMVLIIDELLNHGLDLSDFKHIENLSCPRVLAGCRVVDRKDEASVARYFRAQADILEEQLAEQMELRPLIPSTQQSQPVQALVGQEVPV